MAKSKSGTTKSQPLALELMMGDHRKVEQLFKKYEAEKEADEDSRQTLAEQICDELTVHAQVEEELFYPWLRENLSEDKMELVEEAEVEHQTAKDLIDEIEGADTVDEAFDAKVKVLSEYIQHHVEEEEDEIFKEVREMKDELDELGEAMTERKAELMEDMGLEEDASPVGRKDSGKASGSGEPRGSR